MTDYIQVLQNHLKAEAKQQTKICFENYPKGTISYYGVKTTDVRTTVIRWRQELIDRYTKYMPKHHEYRMMKHGKKS